MYPHWRKRPETENDWFEALVNLARHLRGPDGCPWDREHTAAQFSADATEEAGELLDAFANGENAEVEEEWGDVFFVLLAAAAAAEAEGRFTLREAMEKAHNKMIRRHEHVFGDTKASSPEDAVNRWNQIKARERNGE
ncbi:MAG TPA: MazG nucleotide pyrophosphohydrolase domain-containing protein [Candidatus Hydrogenedentes bacterium]|nr:MazG nucleotide pyrophosphohydrolase domain-containing protein [Candidatus Hydrogenedentota bacterium]HQE81366.1 MazG nucleotide pyrophosphohydrolase domain-containing protein [Candidatus Hydrogenedentota bacterium]HQH50937.1 MazG nucleotide pyrophosphohydrolase domain-containing protein [Candidatus Hydrogenedentota bacterium]HQM47051.1 MazG nucleotide pyrophosphohydrolase domain-containing protein [Candidatus Hydrogenedentota bacterium]